MCFKWKLYILEGWREETHVTQEVKQFTNRRKFLKLTRVTMYIKVVYSIITAKETKRQDSLTLQVMQELRGVGFMGHYPDCDMATTESSMLL